MAIDIYGYSSIGTSMENQDNWTYGPLGEDGFYAMVADGLGGIGGGRQASQTALQTLVACMKETSAPTTEDIHRWLLKANENIIRQQIAAAQMKSTVVCLFVFRGQAIWAHLGDSRLYYFYNSQPAFCTADHSVCQLMVRMGEITREEIPNHKARCKLIRALGQKDCEPEIHGPILLEKGEHSFLLCSDGLWERLIEDEIHLDLCKSENAESWLAYLRKRAEKRKYKDVDNNTAIAVIMTI